MDLLSATQAYRIHIYDDNGVETTISDLPSDDSSDPLTQLLNIESQLTQYKRYASFKALSADINEVLND